MEVHVVSNSKKGFTLVELLVSILIMSVMFLALLHSLSLYVKYNTLNTLRNEAIKIAQGCAEQIRSGQSCSPAITKRFRQFSITYSISAPNPALFSSGTNNVTITVSYSFGGRNYSYSLSTVVYKE